jgi:hypothetical protein
MTGCLMGARSLSVIARGANMAPDQERQTRAARG